MSRSNLWLFPAILLALTSCSPPDLEEAVSEDDIDGDELIEGTAGGKADGINPGPIFFSGGCLPGARITLAAVGDLLLHGTVQTAAATAGDQTLSDPEQRGASGFSALLSPVAGDLGRADLTIANLEVPLARNITATGKKVTLSPFTYYDKLVYTTYPMFNAHPSFLLALRAAGVDVLTNANNHALDRHSSGVDATIDALEEADFPHVGTARRSEAEGVFPPHRRHLMVEVKGVRIALLAYTYGTNGLVDRHGQVSYLEVDKAVQQIAALHADPEVDLVAVAPHWGLEYHTAPSASQISVAHRMLEAGADLILGTHPHVLQPMERYLTRDGRETLVIYSLGNFISGQSHLARRSTIVLYVGISKPQGGRARLTGVSYLPIYVNSSYRPQAIDRVGGYVEGRRFITKLMGGEANLQRPEAPLATHPACP